jgi:hypothetical protein
MSKLEKKSSSIQTLPTKPAPHLRPQIDLSVGLMPHKRPLFDPGAPPARIDIGIDSLSIHTTIAIPQVRGQRLWLGASAVPKLKATRATAQLRVVPSLNR